MKNRLPILLALLTAWGTSQSLKAQTVASKATVSYDTIRIASSNLLNYPGSSDTNTNFKARDPYFRRVEHSMKPDILIVQEMTSQIGVDTFKNHVLNYYQKGLYSTVPFHDGYDTDNHLFYKASKVTFISASYIPTDLRDIAEFVLTPIGTADTIRIYSVHLKANNDAPSEAQRQAEATVLRNYLNNLPPGSQFLIVGDFNTYSSSDLGLQKLLESETDNDGRAKDPLNSVGTWHADFSFRFIHTQSPRVRRFGGGSDGGMDDRFDLMLTSYSSLDDNIITSHYTAYGNDGNHFNDSINRLPNSAVPDSVANGLHYSSDHLPVYCDFKFVLTSFLSTFNQLSPADGAVGQLPAGTLTWQPAGNAQSYDVYLDSVNPPTVQVGTNLTDTTYSYSGLILGTKYYWKIRAKNDSDTLFAANAPRNFTTASGPTTPMNAIVVSVAVDSLQLSWADIANNETGYRIYRSTSSSGPFMQDGPDLPANAQAFTDTGLDASQRYYYRIAPFNALGEGRFASVNGSTLAVIPGMPTLSNVSYLSATLTVDPSENSSSTQFVIRAAQDTSVRYVQSDGSLSASPVWRTYAQWGGASGFSLPALHSCLPYAFAVKARNGDLIETPFTADVNQSTLCYAATDTLLAGWNLLSLPVTVPNYYRAVLFPNSSSDAYSWDPGYAAKQVLRNGVGYWLKFAEAVPETIPGEPRFSDSIAVKKGWNIVGSSCSLVDIGTITSNPPGIRISSFWGYSGSTYYEADTVNPMHGYWVKVSADGKLFLSASPQTVPKTSMETVVSSFDARDLNAFLFEDGGGHRQVLYVGRQASPSLSSSSLELPPQPPAGVFDVRFASQRFAELLSGSVDETRDLGITLQTSAYPVKVTWTLNGGDGLEFHWLGSLDRQLEPRGELYLQKSTSGLTLEVGASKTSSLPREFALHQNHPNPFNPSTEIAYDLPFESQVKLTVYSILGVRVATLVDAKQEAGFHKTEWQPLVSSGIYFYRLEAVSAENPSNIFHQVKRMVYLK